MGERIGVHQQTFYDYVGGRLKKPAFEVLEKLKSAFPKLDMNWLIDGTGESPVNWNSASPTLIQNVPKHVPKHVPKTKSTQKGTSEYQTVTHYTSAVAADQEVPYGTPKESDQDIQKRLQALEQTMQAILAKLP